MPKFSSKSRNRLDTCHDDIVRLFDEVIKERDCTIICGARTLEAQQQAFRDGFSKIDGIKEKSKHQIDEKNPKSHAVDVLPYPINWNDVKGHTEFAEFVLKKAAEMGIKIIWGGNWKKFKDRPHFELE
jgi:peptidoglycan L-alanyl-D-glutamate endopeptidase CwlK